MANYIMVRHVMARYIYNGAVYKSAPFPCVSTEVAQAEDESQRRGLALLALPGGARGVPALLEEHAAVRGALEGWLSWQSRIT